VSTKTRLLLLSILFIGGIVCGLFSWMLFKLQWLSWLVIFIIFAAWFIFAGWFSEHAKGKIMKVIRNVICAPLVVVYLTIGLAQPFITIMGTYFLVAMFGFRVPALILKVLNAVFSLELLPVTIGFLAFAVGSILCTNSYWLTKKIICWSPLGNRDEHKYESYREKLAYYLIQPCNVIFLLYLVYFILLAVIGFMQIQYGGSLISKEYDAAILKAFLVFIAFTNMKTKAQSSDLDSQEILKQTMGLFVHDDEEWQRRRYNNKNNS